MQEAKAQVGILPDQTLTRSRLAQVAEALIRLLEGQVPVSMFGPFSIDMSTRSKRRRRSKKDAMKPYVEMMTQRRRVEYNQMVSM